jgi:Rrf2 family protein
MKISTKGRYALRIMMDLATYHTGESVCMRDIARRQEISEKYLEQIISTLNKGGFVRSARGKNGGYTLRYRPEEYTVGQILRMTEGDLTPIDYLSENGEDGKTKDTFATMKLWGMLSEAINGVVDKVTLADLVSWQMEAVDQYVI